MGTLLRVAALLVLIWGAGFAWFALTLPGAAPLSLNTDAVVVLTGGPGRLARGIDVLQQGSAKRLLLSGVAPGVDKGDLAEAAETPRALFGNQIDLGLAAIDTRSNAAETAAWMDRHNYRSLRLVTSTAHMRRARLELGAQLPPTITVLPDAVPVEAGADSMAREYTKFLLRRAALAAEG